MASLKIMGLDLSFTATGFCLPNGQTVTYKPKTHGDLRLAELEECLGYYLATPRPDRVIAERVPPTIRRRTTLEDLLALHGVVRKTLARWRIEWGYIDP